MHGDSLMTEHWVRLSKSEHCGQDPGKHSKACIHFIHGIKNVEQVNVVRVLHRGQGVCALEDQALHRTALFPKLQTHLTIKNRKHSRRAGSRSKPGDKVSRIRPRDTEHMLLTEGWQQRALSAHHLYQKSFVVS